MRKIVLLLCLSCISFKVFAKIWFVNQSVSGSIQNGYYWSTALKSLKIAIDSSKAGDTIKIAAGIYVPGNSLEASFVPKSKVVMLGGYSATDSTLPRNFSLNKTILSGRYSTSGIGMVRHVLRIQACDEFTIIDGFIIQEGHAYGDDPFENELGGGMIISHNSKLKIRNCVIQNNFSYDGGSAVTIIDSNPSFLNCFFLNNDCFGDGTLLLQSSSTSVSNCVFADNVAAKTGAIVSLDKGDALFSNCTFFRNSVEADGITKGCVSAKNSSTVTIRNSIFFANSTNNPNNFGFDAISYEKPEITIDNSIATISNCILQNYTAGTQLVTAVNPLFKDTSKIAGPDNLFFTNDDGLQLVNPCSPALNIGNNSFAAGMTTDIISQSRIYNNTIDLGAYEVQSAPTAPLKTVYVNPTAAGNNSGSSWSNAFTTLQQALLYCADTIKVSAGTYYPSANNPLSSFVLKNKIVILGGYPNSGNPSDIQRDPLKNLSRLSGALPNSNGVKSLKIIYANRTDSTCLVDGFVISDAKSHNWDNEKTAIRIANKSNPVFRNCVVENNEGGPGAGLQVDKQSSPTFFSCKFINNRADQGGAFAILNQSNSLFKNCTFTGSINPERSDGIGIGGAGVILNASASFDSCSFIKNFSNLAGGALYMQKAFVLLNNCSFYGNSISSSYGSGGNDIYQDSVTAKYYQCLFSDSTSINKGGSQYNTNCAPVFERCEFRNGKATHGGVAYNYAASPIFKNCVFYKNSASYGGVLYNIAASSPAVINCIAADNSALMGGSVFYNERSILEVTNSSLIRNIAPTNITPYSPSVIANMDGSIVTIKNSILWANQPGLPGFTPDFEIQNNTIGASIPSVTTIYNSVTQVYGINGVNNNAVGVSPRLIDYYDPDGPDNKFFTNDDGLRLSSCSPVINAGLNTYASGIATDQSGNSRIHNTTVDIGAYEYQGSASNTNTFYVNPLASGNNSGTSWSNAYSSLHTALLNVCADTIKVAAGTYYTAKTSIDSFYSVRYGVVLLGGYPNAGNPTNSQRNSSLYPTILSGNSGSLADSSDNARHVLSMVNTDGKAILDGFTLQDGFGRQSNGNLNTQSGAGLQVVGTDVTVRNCIVQNNYSHNFRGGGIFVSGGSKLNLEKSVIQNNKAEWGGGLSLSSPAKISNTIFYNNIARSSGGGLYTTGGNISIINGVFHKNNAEINGGGGAYNEAPFDINYINCTVTKNTSLFKPGGGIYVNQDNESQRIKIYNTIFELGQNLAWNDAYFTKCDGFYGSCLRDMIFNCRFLSSNNTTNRVGANPYFVDINNAIGPDNKWMTADDGLQLTHCSDMIDKGMNSVLTGVPIDIINNQRIYNGINDLGAYEYHQGLYGTLIVNAAKDSAIADKEFTDSTGWTHYFRWCSYLLSIKKEGKDIGSITDNSLKVGIITSSAYGTSQPTNLTNALFNTSGNTLYAFNKYWFIQSNSSLTDSLLVRFPYDSTDFNDLKGANPSLSNHEQLQFYRTINTGNPYSPTLPADSIIRYTHNATPSTTTYKHVLQDNYHISEFFIKQFGSGTAVSQMSSPLPDLTLVDIVLSADSVATSTNFSIQCKEKNTGPGIAGINKVVFYLSTDTVLNTTNGPDQLIGEQAINQYLQPGQLTGIIQQQVNIACTTIPGPYYILMIADNGNHVAEANELNNLSYKKIKITQGPLAPSIVTITSNRSSDVLCQPESAIITASSPGCTNCTYEWNTGDTSQSITIKQTGTYEVQVKNLCGSVKANRSITFNPSPVILPIASPSTICLGDSVFLNNSADFLADSVIWTGPDGFKVSPKNRTWTWVTPRKAGNLTYTETAYSKFYGCSTSKDVIVTVFSKEAPALKIAHTGCANPMTFKIDSATNAGTNPLYKWYKNDTLINTGDNSITLSNFSKGTRIYATLKSNSVCSPVDTTRSNEIIVDCVPTGIDEIDGVKYFSITPNPSSGQFFLKMTLSQPKKIAVSVFNGAGNKIYESISSVWAGQMQNEISLVSQPAGIYYMQISVDNKPYGYKLLIVR